MNTNLLCRGSYKHINKVHCTKLVDFEVTYMCKWSRESYQFLSIELDTMVKWLKSEVAPNLKMIFMVYTNYNT